MIERMRSRYATMKASEGGFTLVELLVVIVILAVLAAVVVFAVTGIQDRGQLAACDADLATLQHAQESFSAAARTEDGTPAPAYTDVAGLAEAGFLSGDPADTAALTRYHTIAQGTAIAPTVVPTYPNDPTVPVTPVWDGYLITPTPNEPCELLANHPQRVAVNQ